MATIAAKPITTYSPNDGDIFDKTYYDTADLVTGTVSYQMFNVPASNANPQTITNLSDPGQMSTGVQFQVQSIGIRVYTEGSAVLTGLELQTIFNQLGKATITFTIVGKGDYGEWPVQDFLGVTSFDVQGAAGVTNIAGLNAIIPSFKKLRYPINLASRVRFGVNLNFNGLTALDAATAKVNVKVLLKGVEQRRK